MFRYKLVIAYNGTGFHGFQRQNGLLTIQGVLEQALKPLTVNNQASPKVYCAGRTDTGVHALGQVIHFDLDRDLTADKLKLALNHHLKNYSVVVKSSQNLGENSEFHARFSATSREYHYKILQQDYPDVFTDKLFLLERRPLDVPKMQQVAQLLVGHHDFTNFRSSICSSKSPYKTIDKITVERNNDIITVHLVATSFLHHQVRFIVGALCRVGLGKAPVSSLHDYLYKRDIKKPILAPAHGLYLLKVNY